MGRLPLNHLRRQRRKSLKEIKREHAWWGSVFYRWRNLLLSTALSIQTVEIIVAAIEGRPPELRVPLPFWSTHQLGLHSHTVGLWHPRYARGDEAGAVRPQGLGRMIRI